MKAKRMMAMGMAAALAVSTLAGCGSNSAKTTTDESKQDSTQKEMGADAAADSDAVTLKWVTIGNGMPENYDSWIAAVNQYVGDKIGVNIEMEVVPWGDWDNRRNIIISTNEDYDIIFGNGNVYTSDINLGAYYDITDLLSDNMPGLNQLMPEEYWDAVTVNGRIYGVPTYKDSSMTNFAIWDKEIVDKYNVDINQMTDISKLTDTFAQIKADTSDYPVYVKNDGLYYIFDVYDQLGTGCQALGVRYDDKDAKACFTLEQDDIYAELETIHDWYKKGIINPDAATLSEGRVYNAWRVAQGWPSAAITSWGPSMGKDVEVAQVGDTILSNDTVRGSVNMISANTKYPEKCLQFLDLLNTDTKLRDMFFYGEEGVNFEYTDDSKVHKINEDWSMAGYTQATFFTVSQQDTDETNQWDEVKKQNENAVPSVLLGFTFDTTNVADQLANCNEVWMRYKSEVLTGVQDPAKAVPEIKEEMMAAGLQDVLDEAQAQIDEFMSNK